MKHYLSTLLFFISIMTTAGQDYRWQQKADYTMEVNLNTENHRVDGTQKITYYNNSPDTLYKVYFHLYFNAFQPGSMMDVRSRTIADPDQRIGARIAKLKEDEIGFQNITSLTQDKKPTTFKVEGTIMEVTLPSPILPKTNTTFDVVFQSQVPIQIRRSGRNNAEGISYSMTQWYPKLAEYDHQGWHTSQYVAREFHSVWGDYDVKINLDRKFVVASTGKIQNPQHIGHGYQNAGEKSSTPTKGNLTWHFIAKNVIDFAWTADPDYTHDRIQVPGGPELHFFYQANEKTKTVWREMQPVAVKIFQHLSATFGQYPYDTYSIIQGGDGGMEYPMCTLITGERNQASLNGVVAHEVAHSWFQMVLASNESLNAWMDEGFASFASEEAIKAIKNEPATHAGSYAAYFSLIKAGLYEVPNQHSDHFNTNRAYTVSAYAVGAIFLHQLKYLIGSDAFYQGMLNYYNTWKHKHPEPNDFIRVMEKSSGLQLHWYLNYFINTTKTIDYAISEVTREDSNTNVKLIRINEMPMPIDLMVTYKDGTKELFYIPMNELLGKKSPEDPNLKRTILNVWNWVTPLYSFTIPVKSNTIEKIEIDPSNRMADIDRSNNIKLESEFKSIEK